MFSYEAVKDKVKLFLTLTSLTVSEFEAFLPYFQKAWDQYVKENYIDREGRKRAYGAGQQPELKLIEDKLLFILYYVKIYPLQEIIAFEFGMSQSTANDWIHILSQVFKMALDNGGYLPERDPDQLESVLEAESESEYGIDGTERRKERPKDNDEQKKYYSGKKKTHTLKNVIVGGLNTRQINYLGQTHEGKKSDKKIVDEEEPTFPEGTFLFKDKAFQGYEPENTTAFQPKKKPKGKELTTEEKENNTLISRIRIVIEHIIAGIKRCRIVKDVFRNTKKDFDDLVMEIACGLHNFRTQYRQS